MRNRAKTELTQSSVLVMYERYYSLYHDAIDFKHDLYSSILRYDMLGLYSLSGKTSYRQISWSLEAVCIIC